MNEIYASLLAQMVAQAMRVVGVVVPHVSPSVTLQLGLSLFLSHSLTSIGMHPLQAGLSLFLGLGCLSFPSLLQDCRSFFRSLSSPLGPVSHYRL